LEIKEFKEKWQNLKYRKVKMIEFNKVKVITEVPKKVREPDKILHFNIFPTKNQS
jgi:hypothetical protein